MICSPPFEATAPPPAGRVYCPQTAKLKVTTIKAFREIPYGYDSRTSGNGLAMMRTASMIRRNRDRRGKDDGENRRVQGIHD